MERVLYEYETEELIPPKYGHRYNVREKISIDGGKTYYYTGTGYYCKTLQEAIHIAVRKSIDAEMERKNEIH